MPSFYFYYFLTILIRMSIHFFNNHWREKQVKVKELYVFFFLKKKVKWRGKRNPCKNSRPKRVWVGFRVGGIMAFSSQLVLCGVHVNFLDRF